MSVTRCLGPAVRALSRASASERWRYIGRLPRACSDPGCTLPSCRDVVSDYFRIQKLARENRARLDAIEAQRNGR